jgi:hypothetical protein
VFVGLSLVCLASLITAFSQEENKTVKHGLEDLCNGTDFIIPVVTFEFDFSTLNQPSIN